ncbi:MAG: hypothetical protein R3195_14565 [Gemmatimonadota bacterium]|nr:hypothetical protein [Gemmatimonadota bacterium]
MLDLDASVMLALALSVASAVLCVGYGLRRWHADDDPAPRTPPSADSLETGATMRVNADGVDSTARADADGVASTERDGG